MSALSRHAQRLFPGEVTFPELALAVLVPARDRLPCGPQHRVGHAVGRKRDRYAAVQQPPDRDAVTAELIEAVAIARHPEETRHYRGDDAERLHATDLSIGRLVDVDHHPAAV